MIHSNGDAVTFSSICAISRGAESWHLILSSAGITGIDGLSIRWLKGSSLSCVGVGAGV